MVKFIADNLSLPPITVQEMDFSAQMRAQVGNIMVDPKGNPYGTFQDRMRDAWSHLALADVIRANGQPVDYRESAKHSGSSIAEWTRDSYMLVGDRVFFPDNSSMESPFFVRNGDMMKDRARLKQIFEERGIKTQDVGVPFQGGDILVDEKHKTILYAYPWSSDTKTYNEKYAPALAAATGYKVIPLHRSDYAADIKSPGGKIIADHLYHLDLVLTQLPNGKLLVFPDGLKPDAYSQLEKAYGKDNLIKIEHGEETLLTTNAKFIGNTMITPVISERLRNVLEKEGIKVVTNKDVGSGVNLQLVDSGPHCLTNEFPMSKPSDAQLPTRALKPNYKAVLGEAEADHNDGDKSKMRTLAKFGEKPISQIALRQ